MFEDHIWLRQLHDQFADERQRSRFTFVEVQEYRQEIAVLWNDDCAKEMNARFLNAMAESSEASLEAMRIQSEALARCRLDLENAHEFFNTAIDTSAVMHRHLEDARSSFRTIESQLNHGMAEFRVTDDNAAQADQLATEAEMAGNRAESAASYHD